MSVWDQMHKESRKGMIISYKIHTGDERIDEKHSAC